MNELYTIISGQVVRIGELINATDKDFRGHLDRTPEIIFPKPSQQVHEFLMSHVGTTPFHPTRPALRLAWGQEDGTAAPTVSGGNFVFPTTRTWFDITAWVQDIVIRQSIDGPQYVLIAVCGVELK